MHEIHARDALVAQEDDGRMATSRDQEMHERLEKVEGAVRDLQGDVRELKGDVDELKIDVSELKVDVSELKIDVGELRVDVRGLKRDVHELRGEVRSVESRLRVLIEDTRDDLKRFAEVVGASLERIENRFDSMDRRWEDTRVDHETLMRDHERRITTLEQRP